MTAEVLAAAANADLLALGRQGQTAATGRRLGSTARKIAARAGCSVLVLAPEPRAGQSVLAVFDGSEQSRTSLTYALDVAKRREVGLTILLCGVADVLIELRDQAMQAFNEEAGEPAPKVTFDDIHPDSSGALSDVVKRHDCGLLVIPRNNALVANQDEVLRNVHCPVLLTK